RGLDERFAVAYNDVDFCLRLRKRGLLLVYTPYAVLFHQESSSRGYGKQPRADDDLLEKRWLRTLEPDPYLGALGYSEDPPPPP
ncbi:MAG: glycosyltransferase family 2 protein, partial [Actinobacteria bacterium]|nr:glycosyltransferase family 2 protein [Actinomycetota bacterium]